MNSGLLISALKLRHVATAIALVFLATSVSNRGATLWVTTTNINGAGSLSECLSNAAPGDTIDLTVNGTIFLNCNTLFVSKDVILQGPGADLLRIEGGVRALTIQSNVSATIAGVGIRGPSPAWGGVLNYGRLKMTGCSFSYCRGDPTGGAIESYGTLELADCTVSDCTSRGAGGIFCAGALSLSNCVVSRCSADYGGGGILCQAAATLKRCRIDHNGSGGGGGGYAYGGPLIIDSCTIANNGAADYYGTSGAGILYSGPALFMTNSTVSGNTVSSINDLATGAGVCARADVVEIQSCTIVSNIVRNQYGRGGKPDSGLGAGVYAAVFRARNSIFANNFSTVDQSVASDCAGTMISEGFNLVSSLNGCTVTGDTNSNLIALDPTLGPLQDNGGPTQTHALLLGSPAIGAGGSSGLALDQRGFPRHATCDMGAFEFSPAVPTILKREFTNDRFFRLGFRAPAGSTNNAWSSPNLSDWIPLGTAGELSAGSFEFIDPNAAGQTNRFYQIRQP